MTYITNKKWLLCVKKQGINEGKNLFFSSLNGKNQEMRRNGDPRNGVMEKQRKKLGFGALSRISTAILCRVSPMLHSPFFSQFLCFII
jgi:hypothetical protein